MTRNELEQATYRRLNKATSSPDTATQTRIREFLNSRMRRLLSQPGLTKLRDVQLTFTATTDQAEYGLGPGIVDIYRIVDQTNRIVLEERAPSWYRDVDPDPTGGTSWVWVNYGIQPVYLQPTALATTLVVKSTSASDTNTAYVEYISQQPSRRVTSSVTMTGATGATLATLTGNSPIQIAKWYLSAVAAGVVTVHEDAALGTELGRIEIGQSAARNFRFALWPTPSSAQEYVIEAQRALTDLAQDTDTPPFPEDFHDVLIDGACADECRKMDDSRANDFEALWREGISHIYSRVHGRVVRGGDVDREFGAPRSRLGGWYPAGS